MFTETLHTIQKAWKKNPNVHGQDTVVDSHSEIVNSQIKKTTAACDNIESLFLSALLNGEKNHLFVRINVKMI